MDFGFVKSVHVTTVALSFCMFFVRGIWMLTDSAMLRQRWVRIVPHVNDTVLLAAGVWMAVIIRQYPGTHGWLSAKLIGLVIYVALGMAALRPGRSKRVRAAAWVAAVAVFACIVAIAVFRNRLTF